MEAIDVFADTREVRKVELPLMRIDWSGLLGFVKPEFVMAKGNVGLIKTLAASKDLINEVFPEPKTTLAPEFPGSPEPKIEIVCCKVDVKLASEFFGMLVNVDGSK